MAGYHLANISKGIIGTSSKIAEEVCEMIDAEQQNSKIMVLMELADIYGAIEAYLEQNFQDVNINDLKIMSDITKKVFMEGYRK